MNFFPYPYYGYNEMMMREEMNMKMNNKAEMHSMMKMMKDHMNATQEIKELVNEVNERLKFLEKQYKNYK